MRKMSIETTDAAKIKALGPVGQEIYTRIHENLQPEFLEVIDESELHFGHAGYRDGGESHFKVVIAAQSMGAYNRVERHKKIYALLDDLLKDKIHALSIIYK